MLFNKCQLDLLEKIKNNPANPPLLPQELQEDEEFLLEALKLNERIWEQISPSLKLDKTFILLAIEQNCSVFKMLSSVFKDDAEIALSAVIKLPTLLSDVSDRLKTNEAFKDKATKNNSWFPWFRFEKFIKNTFWEGVADAFALMYGNQGLMNKLNDKKFHSNELKYGLVDLLLFPALSKFLINWGYPTKPSINDNLIFEVQSIRKDYHFINLYVLAMGAGLQVMRLAYTILATLAVTPVVGLVHVLKYPFSRRLREKLVILQGDMYITNEVENRAIQYKGQKTLGEYIDETKSSINDLCAFRGSWAEKGDLTSLSSKNTSTYFFSKKTRAITFFRPVVSDSSEQQAALDIVELLKVNSNYDWDNPEEVAAGR
ncbi:MAG: DUF4116 domain-containing protein, partial [Proteobacteria bacterium]|nr:DUF4116 domain-containing protein [Pseudomonadota bacterium]